MGRVCVGGGGGGGHVMCVRVSVCECVHEWVGMCEQCLCAHAHTHTHTHTHTRPHTPAHTHTHTRTHTHTLTHTCTHAYTHTHTHTHTHKHTHTQSIPQYSVSLSLLYVHVCISNGPIAVHTPREASGCVMSTADRLCFTDRTAAVLRSLSLSTATARDLRHSHALTSPF